MVIHNSSPGKKGNIWLFWNKSISQPQVISVSSQMITVSVGDVLVSGVHAHVKVVQRRFLWSEMQLVSDLNKPWIVLGDFNAVISQEEKVGGRLPNETAMLELSECLNQCELLPAPKTGLQFSWSNCQQGKCWEKTVVGDPAFQFLQKLKELKRALNEWNCKVFGDVNVKIKKLKKE
ncbi:uncharacterized protein LOC113279645 [Papaver somniferum]|uniref:uncharacterized protein LOC113279645 n=1 Tax=Papaver somniferum TaxID=3469 RepID=UPI000E6FF444|nr:uncharacterized protein LOC113279645 [Papaver somniferum]